MNIHPRFTALPPRIAKLPLDDRGYPIPRFVRWIDGKPDFRIIDPDHFARAIKLRRCWICGEPLGRHMAFVIGPMCAINRISSEPPSHLDCALFAATSCPFLSQPLAKRRERDMPADTVIAGFMIERNPGVTLVWITEGYRIFRPPAGGEGLLMELNAPTSTQWFAHGRPATRDEVLAAISTGLPALKTVAAKQGNGAEAELVKEIARFEAMNIIPEV